MQLYACPLLIYSSHFWICEQSIFKESHVLDKINHKKPYETGPILDVETAASMAIAAETEILR